MPSVRISPATMSQMTAGKGVPNATEPAAEARNSKPQAIRQPRSIGYTGPASITTAVP